MPRNDDGEDEEEHEGNLSIFSHSGRSLGRAKSRYLTEEEYRAVQTYILLNCPEVQTYIK